MNHKSTSILEQTLIKFADNYKIAWKDKQRKRTDNAALDFIDGFVDSSFESQERGYLNKIKDNYIDYYIGLTR